MVFFDADIAAAPQRGVHMLVGFGVRGHKVQQTLQECAHLYVGLRYCTRLSWYILSGSLVFRSTKRKP